MEEKNELSLDQLKEIYKTQTEAYLDFNLALINILSNQKDLLSKIENLHGLSDAEFKNLIKEYYALEKLFVNFQNTQSIRDTELNTSVEENTAQMSHFGAEFANLKIDIVNKIDEDLSIIKTEIESLKNMHWDFKNLWNKFAWTIGGIIAFLSVIQLFTGKTLIQLFSK
jgi:hypothetical protein